MTDVQRTTAAVTASPGVHAARVTYSRDADAAYVYLTEIPAGGVAYTHEISYRRHLGKEGRGIRLINLDFDAQDRLLGIEVIGASLVLPPELLTTAETP